VLDFEATCDEAAEAGEATFPLHLQEIIEFPCVLLDARQNPPVIVSETQAYVRPIAIPRLTRFCTDLTGITQATVDAGMTFEEAMRSNCAWLRANHLDPNNPNRPDARFAVVTCGNWDLESMLPRQLALLQRLGHRVPQKPPACYHQWINVQQAFRACYGHKGGGMKNMLRLLGIPLTGRHHSGLDDCRNTAKIVVRLLQDGWALPLTTTGGSGALRTPPAVMRVPGAPTRAPSALIRAPIMPTRAPIMPTRAPNALIRTPTAS
jgi:inhibitor of KinA sporulation pathway (predicted exonuclease)